MTSAHSDLVILFRRSSCTHLFSCFLTRHQVEQFKQDPSPSKCLHSEFDVNTGDEVHSYNDYHHLQVSCGTLTSHMVFQSSVSQTFVFWRHIL